DYRNFLNPLRVGQGNMETEFRSRFVGYLSFAVNYQLSVTNVFGYHVTNVTIHILNTILIFFLLKIILRTPYFSKEEIHECRTDFSFLPLLSALFFGLHPIETQSITYIVQRFSSLAAFFCLLSLFFYIRARLNNYNRPKVFTGYVLPLFFMLLSIKTKELAVIIPLLIFLIDTVFFGGSIKRKIFNVLPFLLLTLIVPLTILSSNARHSDESLLSENLFIGSHGVITSQDYLLTQFRVIVTYIRLLFVPIAQNFDYDFPVYKTLFNPQVFLSFLFILGIVLFSFYLFKKSGRNPVKRLISFGIFWFFITLLPESSVIPIADVIFEHRLYLPSIGFLISFSACLIFLSEKMKKNTFDVSGVLALILFVLLGVLTYKRNSLWQDGVAIWEDAAKKSPLKVRPHNSLGNAYLLRGDFEKAIKEYEIALRLMPSYFGAYYNMGRAYEKLGNNALAEKCYLEAIILKPNFPEALNNIGTLFKKQGQNTKAHKYYALALTLKPDFVEAINNEALLYAAEGWFDVALNDFEKALRIDPSYEATYNNLGNLYFKLRRFPEAISHYQRAIALKPDFAEAHNNLGNCYDETGNLNDAVAQYTLAVKLKPDFAEAHNNLGTAFARVGRVAEAKIQYEEALRLKPNYEEAAYNLGLLK
ncbi:MAG: tetratricopeptide repeat protein, partial [Nitrospirae bacterium]|nr:tetratricopeptide repeat protein [Nitrospirota bacterium]